MIAAAALAVIFGLMAAELGVSRHNERRLRSTGAIEPAGDVYPLLRIVYPAAFAAMGVEAFVRHRLVGDAGRQDRLLLAGAILFAASKVLKTWAIASLGPRWSFRVLIEPRRALVSSGPYRYLRHPNYVAIAGELIGSAIAMGAPATGIAALVAVGVLLRQRIDVEERALGLRT